MQSETCHYSVGWSLQKFIRVLPYGSVGIDAGGMFRIWLDALGYEFAKLRPPVKMFTFDGSLGGYNVDTDAGTNRRLKSFFKLFGCYMGTSFFHGQQIPFGLSWQLLKQIQGGTLAIAA
ncbi:hypothetical protein HDE_04583 [Halotydeus destructor]|nr:hypothetical protein HDE_04583 [Halotydeus destructor]